MATADVTVIVAARNYARFLGQCLESILAQTVRPAAVIYVDDGSEDDSLAVAARYPAVRAIPRPHEGVAAARNAGLAEARTTHVLHVDGDDVLPPEYLAAKWAVADQADFVYSPAQCFGRQTRLWEAPDWSVPVLWSVGNYVNTSTLFRRRDLALVGGWRRTLAGTSWDWDLALRLAQAGFRGLPERAAPLRYRKHGGSLSDREGIAQWRRLFYLVWAGVARVAVVTVYSGRLPGLLPRWVAAVAGAVARWRASLAAEPPFHPQADPTAIPAVTLRVLDTSPGGSGWRWWRAVEPYAGVFDGGVSIQRERWPMDHRDEAERQHKVCTRLAAAYNRLADGPEEICWSIEDDILVPPNALADLHRELLLDVKYATSGVYRNRHVHAQLLGADWPAPPDRGTIRHLERLDGDRWCDLAGTGCLLWHRVLAPHRFQPYCHGVAAHDWAWSLALRESPLDVPRDRRVRLVASVGCRHYLEETRYLEARTPMIQRDHDCAAASVANQTLATTKGKRPEPGTIAIVIDARGAPPAWLVGLAPTIRGRIVGAAIATLPTPGLDYRPLVQALSDLGPVYCPMGEAGRLDGTEPAALRRDAVATVAGPAEILLVDGVPEIDELLPPGFAGRIIDPTREAIPHA